MLASGYGNCYCYYQMNDATLYDRLLNAGREPSPPCPLCTGDKEAEPCGEECASIIAKCVREQRIRGYYMAAKSALILARAYEAEWVRGLSPIDIDARVKACVNQVHAYRLSIRNLRAVAS